MSLPRHLVSVWNPAYAANAMEAHLAVLLHRVSEWRGGRGSEGDVYVWWGKIRSENRLKASSHEEEMRTMDQELERDEDRELQLYLTDYRSLFVSDVERVSWHDESEDDSTHVPEYYRRDQRDCDCWFKLRDIRRLVADDTIAVIQELRLLRNLHYHERPVSLYGGMVDLPLVVVRPDGRRFFDDAAYAALPDGQLWVEFDAEAGGTGALQRELRENLFGDSAWLALDTVTRTFVATGEKVFRDHRGDDAFDFQAVLGPLAKAVEVQVNGILRSALRGAPSEVRHANIEGHSVDLASAGPLTLGQLARAIGGEREMNQYLARALENGAWFTAQLPAILEDLARARNPAAHSTRVPRDIAQCWRERLVGVGCQGVLVDLTKCRLKGS